MSVESCDVGGYSVQLIRRVFQAGVLIGEYPLDVGGARLQRINYSRVRDQASDAEVTYITSGSGDCCGKLKLVDHWNTDMIISYEDEVVWAGTVQTPLYQIGSVVIPAKGYLIWAQVRNVVSDVTYDDMDVADIATSLWNSFVASVDPPRSEVITFPSGVRATRAETQDAHRKVFNVFQEMLTTGLDVTEFGSRIIIGSPPFSPLDLSDTDVIGDVTVSKDADRYGNYFVANASQDIVGTYPPGPRQGSNGYPLVEGTITDSSLQDEASAIAAAKASYEYAAGGVRRIQASGGLRLLPSSGLIARELIAGQLINFAASQTCYVAKETLALGSVQITMEAGDETAIISLEPFGQSVNIDMI